MTKTKGAPEKKRSRAAPKSPETMKSRPRRSESPVPTASPAKRKRPSTLEDAALPDVAPETPGARELPKWPWTEAVTDVVLGMAERDGAGTPIPGTPVSSFERAIRDNVLRVKDVTATISAMGGSVDAVKAACDEFKPGMGASVARLLATAFHLAQCTTASTAEAADIPKEMAEWLKTVATTMMTPEELTTYIGSGDVESLGAGPPIPFGQVSGVPSVRPVAHLVVKCACTLIVEEWDD